MKKYGKSVTILAVLLAVLAVAGSALAYGGRHHGPRGDYPPQGAYGPCGNWEMSRYGGPGPGPGGPGRHFGPGYNMEIPQTMRDKMAEAQKIGVDLRMEMTKPTIDKDKALELYRKQKALQNEISEWFFLQRLERAIAAPAPTPTTAPN